MSHNRAKIGFAAGSRRAKKAIAYRPSVTQIQTARRRMVCTLDKHDGATPIRSLGDAVDFFCKEVYNRGEELGTYAQKQFKTTIMVALNELLQDGEMLLDLGNGRITLTGKAEVKTKRRKHHQKYPSGHRAYAVA